jgi:hypothetical protein
MPAVYTLRSILKRRFSLQTLLVLPVIVSVFLTAAMIRAPAEADFRNLTARLILAMSFAPPVVGIGLLTWWSAKGNWKRVTAWLGMIMLVSALAGGLTIFFTLRNSPLLPEESLDWTGWYHIVLVGAYLTSWIAMLVLTLEFLVKGIWKHVAARRSRRRRDVDRPGEVQESTKPSTVRTAASPSTIAANTHQGASLP